MSHDPLSPDYQLPAHCIDILDQHLARAQAGHNDIIVPKPAAIPTERDWHHFHHNPELFIQIGGATHFRFPNAAIRVDAGQICLVPRQLAHQEYMVDGDQPFCNIVLIAFQQLSYHVMARDPLSKRGVSILHYEHLYSKRCDALNACMDELVLAHHGQHQASTAAIQGFSLALLSMLRDLISQPRQNEASYNPKIKQCLEYIDFHISNSLLSVHLLAKWLGCHPDYLSKLFHNELQMRLNSYINDKRIALAKDTLHATNIPIADVAQSCGFQDPAYFSRQFKKHVGKTPHAFRNEAVPSEAR